MAQKWVEMMQSSYGFDDATAKANILILTELFQEGYITERDVVTTDQGIALRGTSIGPAGLIVLGHS